MTGNKNDKPDAFKAVMAAARADLVGPDLAHQCRGRDLSPAEEALADALMEVYTAGALGVEAVAAALAQKGVRSPSSGSTDWTAETLSQELAALNANLDRAYAENGFGG